MAINKNHEFEELEGIKCAIVEKNIYNERAMFLKDLLTINGYTVVIIPAPPPKAAKPVRKPAEGEAEPIKAEVEADVESPKLFNVGVTDLSFNAINAIFGRQLKTKGGCVVTQAYWNEEHTNCDEEVPYYTHTKMADSN